jgi:beta-galactosidase
MELAVREKNGDKYAFVLNYQRKVQNMWLKKELKELLSGSIETEEVIMQGYEVKIFKL